jgi:ankyrin repeat protein
VLREILLRMCGRILEMFYEHKLDRAILNDDVACVEKLLRWSFAGNALRSVVSRIGSRESERNSPLHVAAYSNSVEVARLLLKNGEDADCANCIGETPLHVAARYNAWETADLLIGRGAKIVVYNQDGQTPLDVAINCGNRNVEELLRLAESLLLR